MNNRNENGEKLFERIKAQGDEFRAPVPPHAWNSIESRLDQSYTKRKISFYRYIYRTAIVSLILGVSFLMIYKLNGNKHVQGESGLYAENIEMLQSGWNVYPVYNVHKLNQAYKKLAYPLPESTEKEIRPMTN